MTRRLYYVSDTHHELLKTPASKRINIFPDGDIPSYLALCGDIGNPFSDNYLEFVKRHSERFQHVFIVAGNHEYYSHQKQKTIEQTDERLGIVSGHFKNVSFLQKNLVEIPDVTFVGCTLWSPVTEKAELLMTDYSRIYTETDSVTGHFKLINGGSNFGGQQTKKKYFRPGRRLVNYTDIQTRHIEMKDWLTETLTSTPIKDKKCIVLTHHAPSLKMLEGMRGVSDEIYECYSSNCDQLFQPPVISWISGHTHLCKDLQINGIPSLSNCFGYPNQKTGYVSDKFFLF